MSDKEHQHEEDCGCEEFERWRDEIAEDVKDLKRPRLTPLDPASQGAADAANTMIDHLEKAYPGRTFDQLKAHFSGCDHPEIEPQLVCEKCGHRESIEPVICVENINNTPYLTIAVGDFVKRLNISVEVASDLVRNQGVAMGPMRRERK